MEHPIPVAELSAAVQRVVGGPPPARLMAARGLAPLSPPDLLTALYQLSHEADAKVAEAAAATFGKLPETVLASALAQPLDPRVLDFAGRELFGRDPLMEVVLRNTATSDETFVTIAAVVNESLAELMAANEQRLLRHPAIIEALYFNKSTRMSTADRIVELAVRNGVVLDRIPVYKDLAAAIRGQQGSAPPGAPTYDTEFHAAFEGATDEADTHETIDDEGTEKLRGAYETLDSKVRKMTVPQKVRLALIGTPSHRSLLVRDANKMVALAAINSPKITDGEVRAFVSSRSVPEEVIREIARKREWTRDYQVKVGLVNNPKTPLAESMKLLVHMRPQELRHVAKSKNIPSALANAARNQLSRKGIE